MFGNEVTHMTLISNKDVCENKVDSGIDPYDVDIKQGRL